MPTYEYLCNSCGHNFEKFQSITASPLQECPNCLQPGLERLIGLGAGIIFKGSGFYKTDYRSESYQKAASKDSPKDSTAPKASSEVKNKPEVAASKS